VRHPVGQILVGGVPAVEDWHERDDTWRHPRYKQQERNQPLGDQNRILQRLDDGVVPVHADTAQVQYGRGGEIHVTRVPHVTHKVTENPLAADQLTGVECHRYHGHQHVCKRQRHDEVVGDHTKPGVSGDGNDHQQVAANRCQYNDGHDRRFQSHRYVIGPVHHVTSHLHSFNHNNYY